MPILAILFAVARGFGFDNLMEHQFRNGFGGNIETTEAILSFVNSYLSQTKGGVFIGVRFSDVVMDGHQSGQQY